MYRLEKANIKTRTGRPCEWEPVEKLMTNSTHTHRHPTPAEPCCSHRQLSPCSLLLLFRASQTLHVYRVTEISQLWLCDWMRLSVCCSLTLCYCHFLAPSSSLLPSPPPLTLPFPFYSSSCFPWRPWEWTRKCVCVLLRDFGPAPHHVSSW